jgi:fructokinase
MTSPTIYLFGEVLFDVFPNNRKIIGGAPFNVTWHLNAFGQSPQLISRVGQDDDGVAIKALMSKHQFDMKGLQNDIAHPTGVVSVSINNDEPCYNIIKPSAYDFIEPTPIVNRSAMLYHGTLALRHDISASTLSTLYKQFEGVVFLDVNLRTPWWNRTTVITLMEKASWVKLNVVELDELFPSTEALHTRLNILIADFKLDGILLTLGEKGAVVYTNESKFFSVSPERATKLVDTVGAGDSFTAVFIMGLLQNWPLQETLERAQEFALNIVEQRGAIILDKETYQTLLSQWQVVS